VQGWGRGRLAWFRTPALAAQRGRDAIDGRKWPRAGQMTELVTRTWEMCCRTCYWSPRQESNLYLALRRHLFYPLNYGERIALTGWNGALLLWASALSPGRFRPFCFVLSEAP
jgi:hypothetical protein